MTFPWRAWRYAKRSGSGVPGGPPPPPPPPPPSAKPWGEPRSGLLYHLGNANAASANLRRWEEWLGHPADVMSDLGGGKPKQTWTDIQGGPGTNPESWGGQMNAYITNVMYDPRQWPVNVPVVEAVYLVPAESRNQFSNGQWTNPQIWQKIADGIYDSVYRTLARRHAVRVAMAGRDPRTVMIEFEPEFTGNWRFGSIGPDTANFIKGWRRIVSIFRQEYEAEHGPGRYPLFLWRPATTLRFGRNAYNWKGPERLWNCYPGNDWCDVVGISMHDSYGINGPDDMIYLTDYPGMGRLGYPYQEGWYDFFAWANAETDKLFCSTEFAINTSTKSRYFPYTPNPAVVFDTMWQLTQQYLDRWLCLLYLSSGIHELHWAHQANGQRFKEIWGQGGLADRW